MEKLIELKNNLDLFDDSLRELTAIPALLSNYKRLIYEPVNELLKELGYSEEKKHIRLDTEDDIK